ncbi:MAG: glycosyltransferase family 39 protein [Chloroflexi bacterium]|nr:glycosyltransferase family 39 protein [Chloroflexota bacterium]
METSFAAPVVVEWSAGRADASNRAALGRALRAHFDLWAILTVLVVAVAMRLAFTTSAPPFINADAEGYYLPGHDLAFGQPFQPDFRRTPGYPAFIAAEIWLFGESLQTLVLVQHLVAGPATATLTYLLGRLLTSRGVALAAGLLVAASGPQLLYEHYILSDALFTLLLLGTLGVTVWAAWRASLGWAAAAGVLCGATILCRPAGQLVAPILAAMLLLGAGTLRRRLVAVALCGLLAAVVVLPWMASNYARHGVFAMAGSGRYLLARVVKNDPGGYSFAPPPGAAEDETWTEARRIVRQESSRGKPGSSAQRFREELGLSEAETSRILTALAIQAIRERPIYYAQQSAGFAWQILIGQPIEIHREGLPWKEIDWQRRVRHVLELPIQRLDAERAQWLVSVYDPARYSPLLPLLFAAGLGLSTVGLAPRRLLLLGFVVLALAGSSAALVGPVIRYRAPVDPLIFLLAVQAVVTLGGLAFRRVRRKIASAPGASDVVSI